MTAPEYTYPEGRAAFPHDGLMGIAGLAPHEIWFLLDEAEQWVELNRGAQKRRAPSCSGTSTFRNFSEHRAGGLLVLGSGRDR